MRCENCGKTQKMCKCSGGNSRNGKSMKKGISIPSSLTNMINGLLGVGKFKNVSPAAVAAAMMASGKGGSSGMKDFPAPGTGRASASRAMSEGPRRQTALLSALINAKPIRDPENPYFQEFKKPQLPQHPIPDYVTNAVRDILMPSAGKSGGTTTKRLSKKGGYPIPRDPNGILTPPNFEIDPIDPKNEWAYDQYIGALNWAKNANRMRSNGGSVYEENPELWSENEGMPVESKRYRFYENGRLPSGLVQGRTFWGMPGGRSGRGVGTSKRMSKGVAGQMAPGGAGVYKPNNPTPTSSSSQTPNPAYSNAQTPLPNYGGKSTGGYGGSRATKRMSKGAKDGYPIVPHEGSVLTPPKFNIDPIDPKNEWAYQQYLDALNWENQASSMAYNNENSHGGMVYDQGPNGTVVSNGVKYPDYVMGVPRGLVSGRTKWGFPGGRSGRGVGTAKSMSKRSPRPDPFPPVPSIFPPKPPKDMMEGAPDYVRYTTNARRKKSPSEAALEFARFKSFANKIKPFIGRMNKPSFNRDFSDASYTPKIKGGPTGGSMAMKSMMKSISSMNQHGTRHVVGGYRGSKIGKAMAASQTQTKNRYI